MACRVTLHLLLSLCFLLQLSLLIKATHDDGEEHAPSGSTDTNEYNNSTEEPHEEEDEHHEEEEHHPGHYIIWPSTFGMMIFIVLSGYLFYYCYSKRQMLKYAKEHHQAGFFEKAIVSSTVTGIAAPGMLGFQKEKSQKKKRTIRFPKFRSTRKSNRNPSQVETEPTVTADQV